MAKPSLLLRQALKYRSQRWRRRHVSILAVLWALYLLTLIGQNHYGFYNMLRLLNPLFFTLPLIDGRWRRQRNPVVTGLEDRAQLEYGRSFEALIEDEQKEILARYRVGTYKMLEPEDERVEMERLRAHETAYRIMRWCFGIFLLLYLVGYFWLPVRPESSMNPRGWLDPPVWIVGLVTLALALPNAVWMWMEADSPGEPSVIAMHERQA